MIQQKLAALNARKIVPSSQPNPEKQKNEILVKSSH